MSKEIMQNFKHDKNYKPKLKEYSYVNKHLNIFCLRGEVLNYIYIYRCLINLPPNYDFLNPVIIIYISVQANVVDVIYFYILKGPFTYFGNFMVN